MSRYAAMFDRLDGEGAFGAFVMLGKGRASLIFIASGDSSMIPL